MKESYKVNVNLKCATCGSVDFNANEDKSYVKCETCGREYLGGIDEVMEYNQKEIQTGKENLEKEVVKDAAAELKKQLEKKFSGNKNIKIR